jgi:hypothetical protein
MSNATRSKQSSHASPAPPIPSPSLAALDADRRQLLLDYDLAYDQGSQVVKRLETGPTAEHERWLNAMDLALANVEDIAKGMEAYTGYDWGFSRPNILHWATVLEQLEGPFDTRLVCKRIQSLARRLKVIAGKMEEEEEEEGEREDPVNETYSHTNKVSSTFLSDKFRLSFHLQCVRCEEKNKECLYYYSQEVGTRCLACAKARRGCSFVTQAKATPGKAARGKKAPEHEDEGANEEAEVVELEITPPKTKKGLLGTISSKLSGKRKIDDRSPPEGPSSRKATPHFQMVCVLVPDPPRPLSDYHQVVPTRSPSVRPDPMGPPLSTSPSFSSFEAPGSNLRRNFEVDRLSLLLNASQEDLRTQQSHSEEDAVVMRRRYMDREKRIRDEFAKERALLRSHISQLEEELAARDRREQEQMAGGSSSARRGEGNTVRRGGSRRG